MKSVFECENEKLCMLIYYDAFNGPSDAKIILKPEHAPYIYSRTSKTHNSETCCSDLWKISASLASGLMPFGF